MKDKKPSMEKVRNIIRKVHKDPELMEIARTFVLRHGGKIPS